MWKIIFLLALSCCVLVEEVSGDEDDRKLGDDCDLLEDCESIENAVCNFNDICECKDGYVASSDNSTCLVLATDIGDECQITEQCSDIPNAECKNHICVLEQAVTSTTTTTKPKDECTEDSQCSTFPIKRVCKNGTCVLAPLSVAPTLIDKPCTNDTDCSIEGTTCINKLCKCKEDFVPSQSLKNCLPKAKAVGDSCTETVQCIQLNGSVCESEKCIHLKKALNNFGEKTTALLIGSTCQHDNECKHISHALCLENVCQCEDDYITSVLSNSCLKKAKKEGEPCTIDKQCEDIKGSTCIQQKCVKPGIVGTKLGKGNSGSVNTISKFALAAILFVKVFSV